MFRIIKEEILGKETLEEYKIIEEKPLGENRKVTIGLVIFIGVEAGQYIDNSQVILGEMAKTVLGQHQVPKQGPIGTESDASSMRYVVILLTIFQP